MDETRTHLELLSRVVAVLTNQELIGLLDLNFRRKAAAETELVALLVEASRRRSSLPPTQAT